MAKTVTISTKLKNLTLKNPVLAASGAFGYGDEYKKLMNINKLGGIITKTITLKPRSGNPPPRLVETPSGLMNSIGLQNVGIDVFLEEKLPALKFITVPIIVSIAGESIDEFKAIALRLSTVDRIHGLEINLSCPNIQKNGRVFGDDAGTIYRVVHAVRSVYNKPVLAKLSPMVSDISLYAKSAALANVDGVTVANTYPGLVVDVDTRRPKLGNTIGGVSGPAIRALTVRHVWTIASQTDLPIVASGGIASVEDALEYIIAGASAVSIGTALYSDPALPEKIIKGIAGYMKKNNMKSLPSLIKSLLCRN